MKIGVEEEIELKSGADGRECMGVARSGAALSGGGSRGSDPPAPTGATRGIFANPKTFFTRGGGGLESH